MTARDAAEQLEKYLTDAHSIEQQALAQLRDAPGLAAEPELAEVFASHERETEEHERLIRNRLQARGAGVAPVKDVVGTITGKGFTAFARSQPDTPGKLVAHAYSYEHMELAAYIHLAKLAEIVEDEDTARAAKHIADDEQRMADRLASLFDTAVEASLRELSPDDLDSQLNKYLQDAHAIEQQSLALLSRAPKLAGTDELASAYAEHHRETEDHVRLLERRLGERSASRSALKDAAMRLGALNWAMFFMAQPDTPAKLASFAFAFEHLEIAAYELLRRTALRAGDGETDQLAQRILADERDAAKRVRLLFGPALDASLEQVGVAA
jgi:ferritin-like metal-binding protein YciE